MTMVALISTENLSNGRSGGRRWDQNYSALIATKSLSYKEVVGQNIATINPFYKRLKNKEQRL